MKDTKQRILEIALELFARDGYEAVSTSHIADELGITKGALYKHYKNKRDIFDSIVKKMEQRDGELAEENEVPTEDIPEAGDVAGEEDISKVEACYKQVTSAQFLEYSKEMFLYWTEDEFASNFRKMLTLEQYRDPEMSRLYQQYLGDGPRNYVKNIFDGMGYEDADMRAMAFYGTMFLGYSISDAAKDRNAVKLQIFSAMEKHLQQT